jgi:hypothetical protein
MARLSCQRWNRLLFRSRPTPSGPIPSGPTPSGPTPSGPNILPLSPLCRGEANGCPVASLRAKATFPWIALGSHSLGPGMGVNPRLRGGQTS